MNIHLSSNFLRNYRRLLRKNPQIKARVTERLSLFNNNPSHPSLRLHKLRGKMVTDWSIAIASDLRLIFIYIEDGILLVDIGKHEEVYKS